MTTPLTPLSAANRPERGREVALDSVDPRLQELVAVREIAQAFLTAERPGDVYQFALERVSPIVGATLACVYLIDDSSELMRLRANFNWPERYARFLGDMRVKLGSGPSGTAASACRVVEIPDVFDDRTLSDWQDVATELGFRSMVALPLQTAQGVLGAVTFYFAKSGTITPEGRGLLGVVAEQMAATAEKASLIEKLQHANTALHGSNAELEKHNAALVEARRLQDELLANVSHEMRTPLTAVMGYIALIEEEVAGPVTAEQRETLSQVKASSQKLVDMISDLLELAALKRGDVTVSAAEFDPRDVVREAVASNAHNSRPVVKLIVDDVPVLPMVVSDKAKVTRIVSALICNAYKFTDAGEVKVSVSASGDQIVYRVTDTGIGISSDAQEFVFDEFRQEDGSATRRHGGSGLGLAIARRLARVLKGDVTLSSVRGKGSTFVVELPLKYSPNT